VQIPDFLPILLASDINVYSMARAFHEAYNKRSLVIARSPAGPIDHSKILDLIVVENLDETDTFLETVEQVAKEHAGKTLLLIGCADHYVRLIVENKERLSRNFVLPYAPKEVLDRFTLKQNFYQLCDQYGLDYAKMYVYKKGTPLDFELDLSFPVVLKPSDTVSYNAHAFPGQNKVYFVADRARLNELLQTIYGHGYDQDMIIQEEVPGHDSQMYDLHIYAGRDKKVKLMNMGNVLLEEHTPKGFGSNAATLVSYHPEFMDKIRLMLEDIGFQGFCDCDIKLDPRDGKFKMFEINIRQGRSHYRVTGGGDNLATYLVDDYLLDKPLELKMVKDDHFWHVVPLGVVYKYVNDKQKVKKIKQLVREGKTSTSLFYKKDMSFRRRLYLFLRDLNHFRKYKRHYRHKV
jgi:D-aspartate ligase